MEQIPQHFQVPHPMNFAVASLAQSQESPFVIQQQQQLMMMTPTSPPPNLFMSTSFSSSSSPDFDVGAPPGLMPPAAKATVPPGPCPRTLQMGGQPAVTQQPKTVEWCIQNVLKKLKTSCGSALISPPMSLGKCDGFRMHFIPGHNWAEKQRQSKGKSAGDSRSEQQQKEQTQQGHSCSDPAHGALRLKVDGIGEGVQLKFYLIVGKCRQGPFLCDFSDRAVQEVALAVNWSKHLEANRQNLRLTLELTQ